jgi:hypothetical protein
MSGTGKEGKYIKEFIVPHSMKELQIRHISER